MTGTQLPVGKSQLGKFFAAGLSARHLVVSPRLQRADDPLVQQTASKDWLSSFRINAVEAARGSAMVAVSNFAATVSNNETIQVVQSSFLTACAVLESNLIKLEQAHLLDTSRAERAKRAIAELLQENSQAYDRLASEIGETVALDAYSDMTNSAQARMSALYEYLESINEKVELTKPAASPTM